jgi:uncharacterized protein
MKRSLLVPGSGPPTTENATQQFRLFASSAGSMCNLDCQYCFLLSEEALEEYIRQLLESHDSPTVTVAWQGEEPTLLGLPFFQRATELVEKYRRPRQEVQHTFQTAGISLDDKWCAFFRQHDILVGLSVDGPQEVHDRYHVARGGKSAFNLLMRGLSRLRRHGVRFTIRCAVNAANQYHGRTVYRFFRDELQADRIQFIPLVERGGQNRIVCAQKEPFVTLRSVDDLQYGRFLIEIFEEWVRRDVDRIFVQFFDVTLNSWLGRYTPGIHTAACGLMNTYDTLTSQCRNCEVRPLCDGGRPEDRFVMSSDDEPGHNYLCAGLELFYKHTRPAMEMMTIPT